MGRPATLDAPALPEITIDDVGALTDSGSHSRGQNYQRQGMIYDASIRGAQLHAMCEGSSGGPYHVQATLTPEQGRNVSPIADWFCDCPRGGFCKHIVALLLTWIETPDAFAQRPPLAALLAEKSREELVALLEQLVDRLPEADDLIERLVPVPVVIPPPAAGAGTEQTVDLAAIRRKADAALKPFRMDPWNDYSYDLVNPLEIVRELEAVRVIGDQYADAGRWADAQAVYETVAGRVMEQHVESFDPEGWVLTTLASCGVGLLRCLDAQAELPATDRLPAKARRELLDSIMRLWTYDHGGEPHEEPATFSVSAGYPAGEPRPDPVDVRAFYENDADPDYDPNDVLLEGEPAWVAFEPGPVIARAATADERAPIEQQARDLAQQEGRRVNAELKRAAIRFLFDLHGQDDDAARLEAYKDAGLWADAIKLLVQQGEVHDATVLAARTLTDTHATLAFANFLAQQGGDLPRQAIAFMEDRLWETEGKSPVEDSHYRHWLSEMYGRHGSPEKSFEVERRHFDAEPGFPAYLAVKTAAELPGQEEGLWERTRPELIKALEKRKELATLLEVHLAAGEVRQALDILPRMEKAPKKKVEGLFGGAYDVAAWHNLDHYRLRLAAAAAAEFPDEAIPLYLSPVDTLIEQRNRGSYRQAAEYLAQVKALYQKTGRVDEWRTLIAGLRETHRRLPALQQELDAQQLM